MPRRTNSNDVKTYYVSKENIDEHLKSKGDVPLMPLRQVSEVNSKNEKVLATMKKRNTVFKPLISMQSYIEELEKRGKLDDFICRMDNAQADLVKQALGILGEAKKSIKEIADSQKISYNLAYSRLKLINKKMINTLNGNMSIKQQYEDFINVLIQKLGTKESFIKFEREVLRKSQIQILELYLGLNDGKSRKIRELSRELNKRESCIWTSVKKSIEKLKTDLDPYLKGELKKAPSKNISKRQLNSEKQLADMLGHIEEFRKKGNFDVFLNSLNKEQISIVKDVSNGEDIKKITEKPNFVYSEIVDINKKMCKSLTAKEIVKPEHKELLQEWIGKFGTKEEFKDFSEKVLTKTQFEVLNIYFNLSNEISNEANLKSIMKKNNNIIRTINSSINNIKKQIEKLERQKAEQEKLEEMKKLEVVSNKLIDYIEKMPEARAAAILRLVENW